MADRQTSCADPLGDTCTIADAMERWYPAVVLDAILAINLHSQVDSDLATAFWHSESNVYR